MTIFHNEKDYERFLMKMKQYKEDYNIHLLAWAVMPNHFHLILKGNVDNNAKVKPLGKSIESCNLRSLIHGLQTSYTMYYNRKYEHSGHVFQGRFKSKHVNSDAYLIQLINYIHSQPSHHNIFSDPAGLKDEEYPYTSLNDYLMLSNPAFKITDIDDSLIDVKDYAKIFEDFKRLNMNDANEEF